MKRRRLRSARGADAVAIECARIASAFDLLLKAAIGRLMLHYASRLASVGVCGRERYAAIHALRRERDAAIEALRFSLRRQKQTAMIRARMAARERRRERVAPPGQYPLRRGPERRVRRRSRRRVRPRPG